MSPILDIKECQQSQQKIFIRDRVNLLKVPLEGKQNND